jgi:hypothetical protein
LGHAKPPPKIWVKRNYTPCEDFDQKLLRRCDGGMNKTKSRAFGAYSCVERLARPPAKEDADRTLARSGSKSGTEK